MTSKTDRAVPSLLAFARSLNPGHFLMFSTSTSNPLVLTPVTVRAEPLRGLNATLKTEDAKKSEAVLQVVESAELAAGDNVLVLRGKLLVRNNVRAPFNCNEDDFAAMQAAIVDGAVEKGLVKQLATRYAINLLSGSWGWRNALESDAVEVTVSWRDGQEEKSVSAKDLLLVSGDRFDVSSYPAHAHAITELADAIHRALVGTGRGILFSIRGDFHMGLGARVYPSQEWAAESVKAASKREWGEKGAGVTRVLAKVRNAAGQPQAIINDRKAGNALRVVDTWYAEEGAAPIAAEIYGANAHQGVALRSTQANSFFGLLSKVVNAKELSATETMYYLAVCVRGGVLGGKE